MEIVLEFVDENGNLVGDENETLVDDKSNFSPSVAKLDSPEPEIELLENLPTIEVDSNDTTGEKATLTLITYNLCGQTEKEDIVGIFDAFLRYSPDVLAIQGMTKLNCDVVFRILKSQGYNYSRFDQLPSAVLKPSFEILFSKIPVTKKEYTPFIKSPQNRGLSKYLVTAGPRTQHPLPVYIFTSQLEVDAAGNAPRKVQILEIDAEYNKITQLRGAPSGVKRPTLKDALKSSSPERLEVPVIFAGDTSIPSWQEATVKHPPGWSDAWREKGTSQNEKTSLYDRSDQVWLAPSAKLCISSYTRIRVGGGDDRAGVLVVFEAI